MAVQSIWSLAICLSYSRFRDLGDKSIADMPLIIAWGILKPDGCGALFTLTKIYPRHLFDFPTIKSED